MAQGAGPFQLYKPGPPLSEFVDFFWIYEGYAPPHRGERLLPTGTSELVFSVDANGRAASGVSGARSEALMLDTSTPFSIIAVHFRPGGSFPFFGVPRYRTMQPRCVLGPFVGARRRQLQRSAVGREDRGQTLQLTRGGAARKSTGTFRSSRGGAVCPRRFRSVEWHATSGRCHSGNRPLATTIRRAVRFRGRPVTQGVLPDPPFQRSAPTDRTIYRRRLGRRRRLLWLLRSGALQPRLSRVCRTNPLRLSPRSHVAHARGRQRRVIICVDQPAPGSSATSQGNSKFSGLRAPTVIASTSRTLSVSRRRA